MHCGDPRLASTLHTPHPSIMVLVHAHHELRTAVKAALLYFLILFYLASACLHFLLLLFIRLISPIFVLTFQLPDFTSSVPLKSNSSVSSNLNSLFLVRSQQTNTQVDVPVPAAVEERACHGFVMCSRTLGRIFMSAPCVCRCPVSFLLYVSCFLLCTVSAVPQVSQQEIYLFYFSATQ